MTYNLAVDRNWVERKLNKFRTALLQIRPNTGAAAGGSKKNSFKNKKTKYHKKTKHHKKLNIIKKLNILVKPMVDELLYNKYLNINKDIKSL
jgi:hypothetical protein